MINLTNLIYIQIDVDESYSSEKFNTFDNITHFIFNRWFINHYNIIQYLFDQKIFIHEFFLSLTSEIQYEIINMIDHFIFNVIDDILNIQIEWNCNNNVSKDIISITHFYEFIKMWEREFDIIFSIYIDRLRWFWIEEFIINIKYQYNKFVLIYQNEFILKSTFDKCDHDIFFEITWEIIKRWFDTLWDFYEGIVTIFVNMISIKSDFSILSWKKNEYRISLIDISFEGIIQCKQFDLLSWLA